MFRITNLEEINDNYSRKLGNQVVMDISDFIGNNISNEYIFIRYMGPKFVIVFSGIDIDSVTTFVTDIKNQAVFCIPGHVSGPNLSFPFPVRRRNHPGAFSSHRSDLLKGRI